MKLNELRVGVGEQQLASRIVGDQPPAGFCAALYVCSVATHGLPPAALARSVGSTAFGSS